MFSCVFLCFDVFSSFWVVLVRSNAFFYVLTSFCTFSRVFACFSALGVLLRALGALLGLMGRSWGALGALLGALGALLGHSWNALGRSWDALGALLDKSTKKIKKNHFYKPQLGAPNPPKLA